VSGAATSAAEGELLTPRAVAARIGVNVHTVYGWIGSGELESIDVGSKPPGERLKRGPWRISERALEKFLAERSTQ
jgi:transposase